MAAGEHAAGERGKQSGADNRGLAAPGRPDHGEQGDADETGHELGDQPLAAVEVLHVLHLVGRQSFERTNPGWCVRTARGEDPVARLLELDDAADQLFLDRPQLRPVGLGPADDGGDAARRLAARPLARHLVHQPREPAAGLEQPTGGDLLRIPAGGVGGGDPAHRVLVEAIQREHVVNGHSAGGIDLLTAHQHEHRQVREGNAARLKVTKRLRAGVIDHEQGRPGHFRGGAQGVGRSPAARVENEVPPPVHVGGELGGQAGLAAPALADESRATARSLARALPAAT